MVSVVSFVEPQKRMNIIWCSYCSISCLVGKRLEIVQSSDLVLTLIATSQGCSEVDMGGVWRLSSRRAVDLNLGNICEIDE